MPLEEPSVRTTRWVLRTKRRLPPGTPALVCRLDDHRDGTLYAFFASPDAKQWRSYAYCPEQERVPLDRLKWDADGSVWELPTPLDSDG
jgi:hypothetical protein